MTTVEGPVTNAEPAQPQGLEEMIYASVEKALATFMANRRSQWRAEHDNEDLKGKGLSPRHHRGPMRFGGPWGHPGMKQGHHGMIHGHHGMSHGQNDMKHGHHGMKHGHHGMRHGHHGMRHGHHGMRHGHHGMRHGHHGMRHGQRFSFWACGARSAEQQMVGADKPVEVVDLVEQEKGPSAEGELQKGIEKMSVGDNAPGAESV